MANDTKPIRYAVHHCLFDVAMLRPLTRKQVDFLMSVYFGASRVIY